MRRASPISRRSALQAALMAFAAAGCTPLAEITATPDAASQPSRTETPTAPPTLIPTVTPTERSTHTPTPTETMTPTEGPLLSSSRIVEVASGGNFKIALREDGRVLAWGWGESYGSRSDLYVPTLIPALSDIDAISAGYDIGLFLQQGRLTAINFYQRGQITPFTDIDGIVQAVAGIDNLLVRRSDGTVWAIGSNDYGQIGDGTNHHADHFVQVPIDSVVDIAMEDFGALAVREDGTVWQWGLPEVRNTDSYYMRPSSPTQIPELSSVIDVGRNYGILSAHRDGSVSMIFGFDAVFTPIPIPRRIVRVETGYGAHCFLLADDGSLWGMGFDLYNLGIGPTPEPPYGAHPMTPHLTLVSNVIDVAAGLSSTLALDADGTVWAWGDGMIANGKRYESHQPIPIPIIYS